MILKTYSKTGSSCRVTFKIPAETVKAQAASVLGEFNGWNADATPMEKRKDGSFSATLTVPAGRPYRFRYLLDGRHWTNDDAPDALLPNHFGSEDSVLSLEEVVAALRPPVKRSAKPAPAKVPPAAPKTVKAKSKAKPAAVAPPAEKSAKPTKRIEPKKK